MKFSKLSQLFLVSTLGLLVATLLTSCAIVTIDYVFVASGPSTGAAGEIQTFDADSQTGALRSGAPTVASGGINPVAMAVTGFALERDRLYTVVSVIVLVILAFSLIHAT